MSPLQVLLISVLVILCIIFLVSRRKFNYWTQRNVPHLKPTTLLGNYGPSFLFKKTQAENVAEICDQFPNEPIIGAFFGTEPAIIVQDPEIIKLVTTKDFYYFNGRDISDHYKREKLSYSFFFTNGDYWKVMRQNISPLFSAVKMKNMFYLVENCSKIFETVLDKEIDECSILNTRHMMARYFMDCIGTTILGIETKVLQEPKDNIFYIIGESIFEVSKLRTIKMYVRSLWPNIFYGLGFQAFSKSAERFFENLLSRVFAERRNNNIKRNDLIDLMLEAKENDYFVGDSIYNLKTLGKEKVKIICKDETLISQSMGFFAAGYDTSAATSTFLLYELAKNPECQKKAFEDVEAYLKARNNKLQYDCISELPYLDKCLMEVLRLYPVLGLLTREVFEDYRLPNGVLLEKGLRVHIPVLHLHRNPKYFPDPEEFKPERFDDKQNIHPYTYMPFGEGPRLCIGMRPAKMQILAGLVTVLKKYKVDLAEGMPREVKFETTSLVIQSSVPIRLKFTPRDGWEERVLA